MIRVNRPTFGIICVAALMVAGAASAQDSARTLGKALVNQAEEKTNGPAPTVPPPPPPGEGGKVVLPPQLEPAILNPIIEKVNKDARAELARLTSKGFKVPSVLFNPNEQRELASAIAVYESGNFIKPIDTTELPVGEVVDLKLDQDRNLVLAGISFGDGKNWVVWLNKQRLTPTRLPPQIRDIKVHRHYVEIRWLDDQSKLIIPVRLRPNQRFNLDTQTFLPG